jgi:hypothetical protein
MFTPEPKIDFTEIAMDISEWIERNYGYFVNKSRDEAEVVKDFSKQLSRLPAGSMSYIEQAKNNFIDSNINRPPLPTQFINQLRIIFNQNKKVIPKPFLRIKKQFNDDDNVGFISFQLFGKNNDFDKIKFIKNLSKTGQLKPIKKYPIMRMIEKILKENNYSNEKIREIINS